MNEIGRKRMQGFRQRLINLRKKKGLSQRQLAYLCNVDHSKISELETKSDSNLTLTTLFEIARGLGVHPKELIDYDFSCR